MRLSREKIQRMINAGGGSSSGGGGGSDIAGGVTQAWVNQNYVSIEFFRRVFKVWAAGETSSDPDVEIMPNDIASTVKNIQAQAGLWTEAFLSALGRGSGGGTGGATTLDQLDDVVITSPTDGQALIYNATTQMWVNGTIQSGTDMATVWSALAAATNEQINASHLSGVLADYVTTTSLQTILGDYLTQTVADQRYITIAYFDRLFRAYNGSTLVSHNDTTSTIDNIKAMFGFWTDMYLSALGRNSAATGLGLDNLTDVTINTPTAGQVLQYNATSSKWVNGALKTINGTSIIGSGDITIAGVSALSGLSDVLLTNLSNNQVLVYDITSQKWVNTDLKTIGGYSVLGPGNIPISGTGGNYLPLAGGTMTGNINYSTSAGTFQVAVIETGNMNVGWQYTAKIGAGIGFRNTSFPGDTAGGFYMWAKNSSSEHALVGRTNGNLTWGADNYLSVTPQKTTIKGIRGLTTYPLTVLSTGADGSWDLVGAFLLTDANYDCKPYVFIGYDNSSYNGACFGFNYYGPGNTNNFAFIGLHSVDYKICVKGTGYVGINEAWPYYQLHVNGNIYSTGSITALSDMRDKELKADMIFDIERIANAPAFSYYWKDKKAHDELLHVGSSAQYWRMVLPEVVLEAKDEKGTLSMQYGVAALVSAITIARKVVDHEQRITELEKENERLRTEIEQLRLN